MSFKVGDIVHMVGTVADIDDVDESYPILVKFDDGQDRSFTKDGKFFLGKSATLSHYNPNEVKELNKCVSECSSFRASKFFIFTRF